MPIPAWTGCPRSWWQVTALLPSIHRWGLDFWWSTPSTERRLRTWEIYTRLLDIAVGIMSYNPISHNNDNNLSRFWHFFCRCYITQILFRNKLLQCQRVLWLYWGYVSISHPLEFTLVIVTSGKIDQQGRLTWIFMRLTRAAGVLTAIAQAGSLSDVALFYFHQGSLVYGVHVLASAVEWSLQVHPTSSRVSAATFSLK